MKNLKRRWVSSQSDYNLFIQLQETLGVTNDTLLFINKKTPLNLKDIIFEDLFLLEDEILKRCEIPNYGSCELVSCLIMLGNFYYESERGETACELYYQAVDLINRVAIEGDYVDLLKLKATATLNHLIAGNFKKIDNVIPIVSLYSQISLISENIQDKKMLAFVYKLLGNNLIESESLSGFLLSQNLKIVEEIYEEDQSIQNSRRYLESLSLNAFHHLYFKNDISYAISLLEQMVGQSILLYEKTNDLDDLKLLINALDFKAYAHSCEKEFNLAKDYYDLANSYLKELFPNIKI